MRILGIETSCDETSAAIVEDGTVVHSCIVRSSKEQFADMGGVIPENAARQQITMITPAVDAALRTAGMEHGDLDRMAVAYGPGLLGSLLVGTTTARVLSPLWNLPLIGVHHHQAHMDSVWLDQEEEPALPCITLTVSGGHTEIWHRETHTRQTLLGRTKDDAAGEAFDKGAMLLGLPYPGGPALAALAADGNERAYDFPLPLSGRESVDCSFSGLKTALKYALRDGDISNKDLAASYQYAICRHLCDATLRAVRAHSVQEVHVVGGVSANERLRSMLSEQVPSAVKLRTPSSPVYCTDNAAMVAAAAFFHLEEQPDEATASFRTQSTVALEL